MVGIGQARQEKEQQVFETFQELAEVRLVFEELDDHVGQANVLNNQGVKAYFKGEWDRALQFYRRSEKARERAGDIIGAATALNNIAEILVAQGDLDGAADRTMEVMARTVNGRLTCAETLRHDDFVITKLYRSA